MRCDGGATLTDGLRGMELNVFNDDGRSSYNGWRQVGFRKNHFRSDVQGYDARQFGGGADVGLSAHLVKVISSQWDGRDVDAWNVIQNLSSVLGVEPGVGVHGIGHEAPLVSALVPVPSFCQSRIRRLSSATEAVYVDLRGSDRLSRLIGDLLAALCTHRLEDLD